MNEKPIIFSSPMVRAIMSGDKTQTRRVLKPQPGKWVSLHPWKAGETMWVREACRAEEIDDPKSPDRGLDGVRYLADDKFIGLPEILPPSRTDNRWIDLACYGRKEFIRPIKNVPAIHMPRWASRITLLVEAVRVERLQDISEADACAEGMIGERIIAKYKHLWGELHGQNAWDANPWVSVTTFRRIKP
tara:strand:- start:69 stop:635 length:567 start_codon:yes stop_codon:yes gene_type:complete